MWKPIALSVNPASDPKPAVDAQPVAIYQTRWAYPETVWGDVTKDVYDRYETFGYVERRTVYASAQLTVNSGDKR